MSRRLAGLKNFVVPFEFDRSPGSLSLKWLLLAVLALKLVLSAVVGTGDTQAFFKFCTLWLESGLHNPWEYIARVDPAAAQYVPPPFPYPPFMLLVVSAFRSVTYVLGWHAVQFGPLAGSTVKLLLLAADLWTATLVWRVAGLLGFAQRPCRAAFFMWHLAGIGLYVTYLMSHLDIIPVCLSVLSLYLLLRRRYLWAALVLALSVASKHYTLILFCPLLVRLLKDTALSAGRRVGLAAGSLLTLALVLAVLYAPVWSSAEFHSKVIHNPEDQRVWFPVFELISGHLWIFLAPFYLTLIALLMWVATGPPERVVVAGSAALLAAFTTFVIPMPNWFLWSLPFVTLLCLMFPGGLWLFAFYNAVYLAYNCFSEYTALTQLVTWWKWGWPLHEAPFTAVVRRAGEPAAKKMANLLFSLLVAGQVAIFVAYLWHLRTPKSARQDPAAG